MRKRKPKAEPLKGYGIKKGKRRGLTPPKKRMRKPRAYIPPLRRLCEYGCQLGRIRLDFKRTGRHFISPIRFAQLLGMSIERYLDLERGTFTQEPTATELIIIWHKVNAIRESFGLPPIEIDELWRVP